MSLNDEEDITKNNSIMGQITEYLAEECTDTIIITNFVSSYFMQFQKSRKRGDEVKVTFSHTLKRFDDEVFTLRSALAIALLSKVIKIKKKTLKNTSEKSPRK